MSELSTNNDIKAFLANPDIQQRMNDLLKERASEFATSILAAVQNDKNLAICEPATIFSAAMTAASLNLPINSNLGFAYLIPYKNNKLGVWQAQFQMGWKGFVQLAQRTGQYRTIGATEVYEGQLIDENPVLGNTFDWKAKKSDKVVGYLAMFQLTTGFEKSLYMTTEQLQKHGLKFSQSYKKGYGLWKDDFHSMALKTVIKLLISKFGPMNTSVSKAVEFDQAVIDGDIIYPDNEKPAHTEQTDEEKEALKAEAKQIAAQRKQELTGEGESVQNN